MAGIPNSRAMIAAGHLPDYDLEEAPGDILIVRRRTLVAGDAPRPSADALEAARSIAPGWDVYALEADWRAFWDQTGRQRLTSPDRAFLGWVRTRAKS